MSLDTQIMSRLDRIEAQTSELLAQTLPRMPQLYACVLGLVAFSIADYTLKTRDIPYLSATYEQITDYIGNGSASLGVWISDALGHVDRSTPSIISENAIRGLDQQQTCRLMVTLRARESSHNYQIVNPYGYLGGYQFGASALATVGLVSTQAVQQAPKRVRQGLNPEHGAFLRNRANWLGSNYQHFLSTPRLQDAAFISLANTNVGAGFGSRALIKTNPNRIAGYIAAAHLKGSGAANSWYLRGKDSRDGNGTRTSDYAKLGEQAINQRTELCGDKSLISDLIDTITR
ncbi:MAG: hypothetical protein WAQ53_07970 [Thiofilum sp.]|uniref:hypothetical protein n=1 Tax=Thiofilum sp. TaxID=2212733 RepID=UPI0025FF7F17|nr:hypothetical protein [Thiofilum sp.]MBK8454118.1 hypothetical protein [Thiofilum sp.]